MVFGLTEVQQRLQNLILHLHQLHRPAHRCLIRSGNECHRIPHVADMRIQDTMIIWTELRISLTRNRKTCLRHILSREDALNAGYLQRHRLIHTAHDGMRMRTAQSLDHKTVRRSDILGINRLPCDQCQRIFFHHSTIDFPHALTPPCLYSRYWRIARKWLT